MARRLVLLCSGPPSEQTGRHTRRALEASVREGERQQSALSLTLRGRYTAPLHAQLGRLLLKDLRSYWRTPEYNATRLTISLGVALIFGSMYWQSAHRRCCEAGPACMCVVADVPWIHPTCLQRTHSCWKAPALY